MTDLRSSDEVEAIEELTAKIEQAVEDAYPRAAKGKKPMTQEEPTQEGRAQDEQAHAAGSMAYTVGQLRTNRERVADSAQRAAAKVTK